MMRKTPTSLLVLLFAACAQIREPQGGEKDTTPPLLIKADPPQNTTRFTAQRIVLKFNEKVKLDHVRDKLLISPPPATPPDVSVSGGSNVIIALHEALAPNTTYTFNIGDAVLDLTEGNSAAGITYVVSTGEWLDSLSVKGSVVGAATDLPEEDVLVILHDEADTAALERGRPAYFTRTDKMGNFHIDHLRNGRFKLSALRDQNADYRFNLPNEEIAFADSMIDPLACGNQRLCMFRELARTQRVMEARVEPDRAWRIAFARPAHDVMMHDLDREGGHLTWGKEWNSTRDTVLMWPSDTALLDERRFAVSDTGSVMDTITYHIAGKMPFYVDARLAASAIDSMRRLITTRPILKVDASRATLIFDSTRIPCALTIDTILPRRVIFSTPLPLGKSGVLELLPKALTDIYASINDTLRIAIGAKAAEQTGDLRIRLKSDSGLVPAGPFILMLLNAQDAVIRQERIVALPAQVEWPGTVPASYGLRLIQDRDGDGRWTTGDWRTKRRPERVSRYNGEVNVRAGWEVEVVWGLKE